MGLVSYRLAKRIDLRSAEELEKELQSVREVSLDTPAAPRTSAWLFQYGVSRRTAGLFYPGPAIAARNREDLASLPFRYGTEATLSREQALALDANSKRLREEIQRCIPAGGTDPRPDPDKLYKALLAGDAGLFRDVKWARAEAVPCIQQMLQAENREIRRVAVELLRGIEAPSATEALVRWSVFDLDAGNRAAAVDALRQRNRSEVSALLAAQLRFPWPRAAEHAAEALLAVGCVEAVPTLAALLASPDPSAIQTATLPDSSQRFRHELVRVNHAKNCLMCHGPSPVETDLVRGAIPDPTRPLPGATTPSYYSSGGSFVHASTTYLKQDFSAVQKVAEPGLWSEHQRFDFLVSTRPAKADESDSAQTRAQFEAAILFALRELTGRDLGSTAEGWAGLRGTGPGPNFSSRLEVARFKVLSDNPEVFLWLTFQEFGRSLLALTPQEQSVVLARFRKSYGNGRARLALLAYLEGIVRSGNADDKAKAQQLLAAVLGASGDATVVDGDAAAKLLGHANSGIRTAAATALGLSGTAAKDHIKALIAAMSDADAEVRLAAAMAIGTLSSGPDEMYDALAKATADPSSQVRLAVAEILAKFKYLPRSSAKPLVEGFLTW
ncbi:MAG: HEAT repeat domain-containing protein [Gemmataceae bacterium]